MIASMLTVVTLLGLPSEADIWDKPYCSPQHQSLCEGTWLARTLLNRNTPGRRIIRVKPPGWPHRSSSFIADVERWRGLVEAHFRPEDVEWALRVMQCESRGNPDAKNPSSTAAGLMQFLRSTWDRVAAQTGSPSYADGGPFDPEWSIVNAAWLLDHGGPTQWSCR